VRTQLVELEEDKESGVEEQGQEWEPEPEPELGRVWVWAWLLWEDMESMALMRTESASWRHPADRWVDSRTYSSAEACTEE
jgi:hypothetical protein